MNRRKESMIFTHWALGGTEKEDIEQPCLSMVGMEFIFLDNSLLKFRLIYLSYWLDILLYDLIYIVCCFYFSISAGVLREHWLHCQHGHIGSLLPSGDALWYLNCCQYSYKLLGLNLLAHNRGRFHLGHLLEPSLHMFTFWTPRANGMFFLYDYSRNVRHWLHGW